MIVKLISFVFIFFKSFTDVVGSLFLMVVELVSVSIVSCEFFDKLFDCFVVVKIIIGIDNIM